MKKIIIVLVFFALSGCKKDQVDPEPPVISFGGWKYSGIAANGFDSLVELTINFKDRNGDIGRIESEQSDKCGLPIYDLFVFYEQKVNNVYSPAFITYTDPIDSSINVNCNLIPGSYIYTKQISFLRALDFIQPEGNNRSIEGEIIYKLDYNADLSQISTPVGRCKVYLIDRARNKSNEIYTEDLILQ